MKAMKAIKPWKMLYILLYVCIYTIPGFWIYKIDSRFYKANYVLGFLSNQQRSMFISIILIAELYIKEMFTIFDSNSWS